VAIAVITGCGGGDGGASDGGVPDGQGSAAAIAVDPSTTVTVDQFKRGFTDETGFELTANSFPGGAQLLTFDDDGDLMTVSEAESAFFDEFGTPQIYVVAADGDPDLIFDVVVGEPGKGEPVEFGDDMARIDRTVSGQPDADGIIWSEQCVVYEKDSSRNVCAWSGTKRYGRNLIVSWTSTGDSLEEAAARLDRAVSAAVAGAGT
jgi:hypothetical protein